MSYENGAGKAGHFSTKKSVTFRLSEEVRDKLLNLAITARLDMTKYLERLILRQKIKKQYRSK